MSFVSTASFPSDAQTTGLPQALNLDWRDALRLSLTPSVGLLAQKALLDAFGAADQVFAQSEEALREVVSVAQAQALQTLPPDFEQACARILDWLAQAREPIAREVWHWGHPRYPAALTLLDDPPCVLFAQGQLHKPCLNGVAVVGSRNPTPQGKENARRFAQVLQGWGCCIVSGLAMGIDAAAHEGALGHAAHNGCPTVAVVGTGLDRVYPRQHHRLAHEVAAQGWLLSELLPGTAPLPHHFPMRNRLIAGLSQGVLVVEAALASGSLITAELALSQGKEVFAIPGSIHSMLSRGCHALLKQGAKLVESAHDVWEELPLAIGASPHNVPAHGAPPHSEPEQNLPAKSWQGLEQQVFTALQNTPLNLEALLLQLGASLEAVLLALQSLEDTGHVQAMPGGLYQSVV
jgi:DNA processing protein